MATEELDTLEKALFELPHSHRRAFVLHRFEDWSTAEIARDLGVGERSARNYISRAAVYCKLRIMGLAAAEAKARAGA